MCCAPVCDKASSVQVASLPLCTPHYNRLESHVAYVYTVDWDKIRKENQKPPIGDDWVYFVRLGSVIKIGHSRRLTSRLRTFASYGQEVEVLALELGGRDLEQRLHRRFNDIRSSVGFSRELFNPSDELYKYIATGRKCAICDQFARPEGVTCRGHARSHGFQYEDSLFGVQLHVAPTSA